MLAPDLLSARLALPSSAHGPIRAVLDTDTFNEIDDQFALAHLLLSPERVNLEAVYAAPFVNLRAATPAEGMEKSLAEIERVLALLKRRPRDGVFAGSDAYLPKPNRAVDSPAARDLIRRAHAGPDPLYVLAIAAPTNVASALLLDPTIAAKIVVVWLGAHALHWEHTREFNFQQDLAASRHLLDCGVPLVLVPCMGVAQMLATTIPELEHYLKGCSGIGGYLRDEMRVFHDRPAMDIPWHKVIWDVAATAWLIDPDACPSHLLPSPTCTDDFLWRPSDRKRHPIRYVNEVKRDPILHDLFTKLRQA